MLHQLLLFSSSTDLNDTLIIQRPRRGAFAADGPDQSGGRTPADWSVQRTEKQQLQLHKQQPTHKITNLLLVLAAGTFLSTAQQTLPVLCGGDCSLKNS